MAVGVALAATYLLTRPTDAEQLEPVVGGARQDPPPWGTV
jgi:hypothetical protein